ncbi:MAG: peptidylprolyl isomerase [Vallitaleaceae bacterium]|jgi:peptidyl-prolyl cis-trans isomerase B (cyclophilin B)|nr:peptidylprolyl isomerase [Vallitaleaceae bacterium]
MKRLITVVSILMVMTMLLVACNKTDDDVYVDTSDGDKAESTYRDPAMIPEEVLATMDYDKQFLMPVAGEQVATFKTNYGDIKVRLFPDGAPLAVQSFIELAEAGFYDGLTFHRVIRDFMIQGGDPLGNGTGGESSYGEPFADEFTLEYLPYKGALCMANSGPDTNGSQFFIVQSGTARVSGTKSGALEVDGYPEEVVENYKMYGGTTNLFFVHTVFGQVYEGLDIVDTIAQVEVGEKDLPVEPVVIESIVIETYQ